MNDMGSRIKATRKRRGLSQKTLARCICKCPSAVSSYENNVQIPPIDVLCSIAKVLNVSLDYLAGMDSEESYSAKNLTAKQKEILDALFEEFSTPTNIGPDLSPHQMQIIQQLFLLFLSEHKILL